MISKKELYDLPHFLAWLDLEMQKYPLIYRSRTKTFNELTYVLRMSGMDFSISIVEKNGGWGAIPSVYECFIPVSDLKKKIRVTDCDYDEEYDTVCITVKEV